jgi:hypothetical protein
MIKPLLRLINVETCKIFYLVYFKDDYISNVIYSRGAQLRTRTFHCLQPHAAIRHFIC